MKTSLRGIPVKAPVFGDLSQHDGLVRQPHLAL
jgi:D-hexose-6-phosphate mutarotase